MITLVHEGRRKRVEDVATESKDAVLGSRVTIARLQESVCCPQKVQVMEYH